jgi:hypothetical protein
MMMQPALIAFGFEAVFHNTHVKKPFAAHKRLDVFNFVGYYGLPSCAQCRTPDFRGGR